MTTDTMPRSQPDFARTAWQGIAGAVRFSTSDKKWAFSPSLRVLRGQGRLRYRDCPGLEGNHPDGRLSRASEFQHQVRIPLRLVRPALLHQGGRRTGQDPERLPDRIRVPVRIRRGVMDAYRSWLTERSTSTGAATAPPGKIAIRQYRASHPPHQVHGAACRRRQELARSGQSGAGDQDSLASAISVTSIRRWVAR